MRFGTFLLLAVLIFFHASRGLAEIYTQETFKAIEAASKYQSPTCKQILSSCSAQADAYRKYFAPAAIACQAQNQTLGCDKLAADHPELKNQIASCDVADICENDNPVAKEVQAMKGCFWNAPGAITKDTWHDIKNLVMGIPGATKKGWDNYQTCMSSTDCRKFVAQIPAIMSMAGPELAAFMTTDQGKAVMLGVYNSGKKWLTDQKIKYQCFKPEAQTEMVCYGAYWAVVNVVAPEKLGAIAATKIPLAIKVLKGAQKAEVVATDTLKAAAVTEEVADVGKNAIRLDGLLGGKAAAQETFIAENTNRIFTSTMENEKWISIAEQTTYDRPIKFYDIENSAMKGLNDTTNNKNLVTALTNKQKEIFFNDLIDVERKYPDMEFIPYSDFKSVRVAVRPKRSSGKIPPQVNKAMQDLFTNTNKKYTEYLVDKKVVDASAKSSEWFRAGSGVTADKASLGARYSRSLDGDNLMVGFGREDLQHVVQGNLDRAEAIRADLQNSLGHTAAMEPVSGTNSMTLSRDTFEVVRKTKSASELKDTLALKTGTKVTDAQAQKIMDYSKLVDDFSPSIRVAQRQVTSLEDAVHGGMTIDFVGLGAENMQSTASALARTNRIKDALGEARAHESVVTKLLNDKKKNITEALQRVFKEQHIDAVIKVSGDDMVIKPSKPLDAATKEKIAEALAQAESPSSIRVSSVSKNITDGNARSVIAAQGESVEKVLRNQLAGKIPAEKLKQTMFMVDIDQTADGAHQAKLLLSNRYSDLSATEKEQIQQAFKDAVKKVNDVSTKTEGHYALIPDL